MESGIFRFVLKHSKLEQILLVLLTLAAFPFLYYSLELPKIIINEAIGGTGFPKQLFGYDLAQIPFLLSLCGIFLTLVLINGAFKYVINVYRGVVGERMLRRLRYQLFARVLRFPLSQFRRLSQGELVSMVVAETEPLGGFIGDSIALPVFQGGTLLTILLFMFVQDPILGGAAIALYPLQGYFIPKLQRRVNLLKKERVMKARKLSESIGEVVSGIKEVHAHDTSRYELARYSEKIGEIFEIRYRIYKQKYLIKFLNNFIAQVTPFFFYSLGGYLVIKGELSFGALVAVLAAYKDLSAPWKELLNYYQTKEDARIKYELLLDTFAPSGMIDEKIQLDAAGRSEPLVGELVATNLGLDEERSDEFEAGVTFRLTLPQHVAIVGSGGSGRHRLSEVLALLKRETSGSLTLGGLNLRAAPQSITGRRIAFAGAEPALRAGSVRDNLLYSLKHKPTRDVAYSPTESKRREHDRREARLSGNSLFDAKADWLDYDGAGAADERQLGERINGVLQTVDLDRDIYQLGLHGTVDLKRDATVADRILEARSELMVRLDEPEYRPLVESFDRARYNTNMSVAENLLFGTPKDDAFSSANLPDNPLVKNVLDRVDLSATFLAMGRSVAELMVELFADVEPGSELFEQFSFISADDLPEFKAMLVRTEGLSDDAIAANEKHRLMSLPFRLTVARHRLGLIDEPLQRKLLDARAMLAESLATEGSAVESLDRDRFNSSASIQDNILFGRLAYGKAQSARRIGQLIDEVVEKLELRDAIMQIGLERPVGVAGARLSATQRQKLSIARCLIKQPDILVVDEATSILDAASEAKIMRNIMNEFRGRAIIWSLQRVELAEHFQHVFVMEDGKLIAQGRFDELNQDGAPLHTLMTQS